MVCPACRGSMTELVLDGHLGMSVTIDLCTGCQAIWFDGHESLQLAPGSTLRLFHLIGDCAEKARADAAGDPVCPRCDARLMLVHDLQRATRFQYLRCPHEHGRFISFIDFLREKNFIRPLSPEQVAALRANVQTVRCSTCGASIDLARTSVCEHCGSPLAMIDFDHAGQMVADLKQAEAGGHGADGAPASGLVDSVDPALPLRLAQARQEVNEAFSRFQESPTWYADVGATGLIGAGLRWLRTRVS